VGEVVGVGVSSKMAVALAVGEGVGVGESTGTAVALAVGEGVGVGESTGTAMAIAVGEGVGVGVSTGTAMAVAVGEGVGVAGGGSPSTVKVIDLFATTVSVPSILATTSALIEYPDPSRSGHDPEILKVTTIRLPSLFGVIDQIGRASCRERV